MPTCSACSQKLAKSAFSKTQLKLGTERRCNGCVKLVEGLFSKALSTRRWDEHSIEAQVERLRAKDANTQMDAANKLWALTRRGEEASIGHRRVAHAPLVGLLRTRGDDRAWTAAMALQSLSCRSEARKAAIASAGAIPLLHALLSGDSDDDKEVAAMVLHNLAFCQNEQHVTATIDRQSAIVEAGSCAALVAMIRAASEGAASIETAEAAVATLASLVGDSDALRDAVVAQVASHGGVAPLSGLLKCGSGRAARAARLLKELAQRDADAAAIASELAFESSAEITQLTDLIDRLALGEVGESRRSRSASDDEGMKSDGSSNSPSPLSLPATVEVS